MKIVNLSGPAVIDGAVRYPIESPLLVSDDEAGRLKASGRLYGEPEDPDDAEDDDVDLTKMKVEDLKALAAAEEIDLGDAKNKADIISAIQLAREA